MVDDTTCARCGSSKIIPSVELAEANGRSLDLRVAGNPDAIVFKEAATGSLSARVCGACGHVELHVSNFEALYEKHLESRARL